MRTPRGAMYCLSQPTGRTGTSMSSATTRARPFLHARDEPRAAAGVRRLHVMVSDPTMSETTTLLKAGTTDLVLSPRPATYRTATSPGPPHGLVWRNGHRPAADPASVHAIRTSSTYSPPRKNSSRKTPSAVKPHDS